MERLEFSNAKKLTVHETNVMKTFVGFYYTK